MRVHNSDRVLDMQVFTLDRHKDGRGHFEELYNGSNEEYGCHAWVQANHSVSRKYVLRGIHIAGYAKLVTCVKGKIYDVVVDFRPKSPTYGRWDAVELSDESHKQVYVPPFCGHAFLAMEDETHVVYFQGGVYDPAREQTVYWNSPVLDIMWPLESPMLSPKDSSAIVLQELPAPTLCWWKRLMDAIRSKRSS